MVKKPIAVRKIRGNRPRRKRKNHKKNNRGHDNRKTHPRKRDQTDLHILRVDSKKEMGKQQSKLSYKLDITLFFLLATMRSMITPVNTSVIAPSVNIIIV